jgi:hypothetical protein
LFLEHDAHNEIVTVQHTEKNWRRSSKSEILNDNRFLYNKMGYFRPIITT